jgi:hypothetical protein
MNKQIDILSKRKNLVRLSLEALDRGDRESADRLREESNRLLDEANKSEERFTSEDAYGLMAH